VLRLATDDPIGLSVSDIAPSDGCGFARFVQPSDSSDHRMNPMVGWSD
jgi:hypothetical protein